MTPPIGGSRSSSSSSDDRHEFHELVHGVDEACQRYSDATHEVSRLECCLDAIRVALEASVSHPVFQKIPSGNYMCAQNVHMPHIATNMENIKNNALLYISKHSYYKTYNYYKP